MSRSTCRGVSLGKFPLDTRRSDMTPWQKLGQFLLGGGASLGGGPEMAFSTLSLHNLEEISRIKTCCSSELLGGGDHLPSHPLVPVT